MDVPYAIEDDFSLNTFPVKVSDILKLVIIPRSQTDGKLDTEVKDVQDRRVTRIEQVLTRIAPAAITKGIPVGNVGNILSHFIESMDVEALRTYKKLHLFPAVSEDSEKLAKNLFLEMTRLKVSQMDSLGSMCIEKMLWLINNYIELWRFHQKLARVYWEKDESEEDRDLKPKAVEQNKGRRVIKRADANYQLMKGTELPRDFSTTLLEQITDSASVVAKNSMAANFLNFVRSGAKLEKQISIKRVMKILHPPNPNSVDLPRTEELAVKFRKFLQDSFPDGQVPTEKVGPTLSKFMEYQDILAIRKAGKMDLFPPLKEEVAHQALEVYAELLTKEVRELSLMGDICVKRMMWMVGNYIQTWNFHQKLEKIYLPDQTEEEVYRLADQNEGLMKGEILPPGMSRKSLDKINTKIRIVLDNSVGSRILQANRAERH